MDYIGVKTFDAKGVFVGERRFVGLFTSSAYSAQPAHSDAAPQDRGGDGARGPEPRQP